MPQTLSASLCSSCPWPCALLSGCSIYLWLCVLLFPPPLPSTPPSRPCLALYLSPRLLSAPSVSDESSGIGMKVTQGNKGSAVSTAVGVESSTQEFPARLPSPSGLLPCAMGLYPPGLVVMPLGSRRSFDSQVPSGNPVSPLSCCFSDGGSQLPLTFLP